MKDIARELSEIVSNHYEKYYNLDDQKASVILSADKWSLKEIIGHLIDSASNNHQRFVRLHINNKIDFPIYHYDWISIENFNSMKFTDLISLWKYFNILLSHIINNVTDDKLSNIWETGGTKLTLKFIITDYLRHIKEHIMHFEERLVELK
jgi:hypothetical protein